MEIRSDIPQTGGRDSRNWNRHKGTKALIVAKPGGVLLKVQIDRRSSYSQRLALSNFVKDLFGEEFVGEEPMSATSTGPKESSAPSVRTTTRLEANDVARLEKLKILLIGWK